MSLQDDFMNGIDRMNKIAYSLINGNAKAWAEKAERKGIISIEEKIEIVSFVDLRNAAGHGSAGRILFVKSDIDKVNTYIRIMTNTAGRFTKPKTINMPNGTFRSSYIKEFNFTGNNNREYYFKFEIKWEYQERAYDDGTHFKGKGYTIYVISAPYRSWCLEHNIEYEFHFYAVPRGSESICWNTLLTSFEDANAVMFVWAKRYMRIVDRLKDDKSINLQSYDNNQRKKYNIPDGTFRDRQLRLSHAVYMQIKKTLGKIKPEQGGILGISGDGDVIDVFVHDNKAKVGYAEYNPNVEFLNNVINNDWTVKGIDFCGFVHSHPSQSTMLSSADIEYSIRIMKEFDLAYLTTPLVTSGFDGNFKIHGFIVHKNGKVEKCAVNIVKEQKKEEPAICGSSNLTDDEIMKYFETSNAQPIKVNVNNQYDRIESCLPLDYLHNCVVVGIGCGGAREFYIDMARMGVHNFVLMDGDSVSITNISSQNVYLSEIGKKKVNIIGSKIKQIDKSIAVDTYSMMLDDTIDDLWIERNIVNRYKDKNIILCAFTDSFFAQARVANIAIKYNLPFISAQHHKYGETSEIVYWYPNVSIATPKSILSERYFAYKTGYQNTVTSDGSPIFNTVRLNALCEKIAIGMLLYNYNKYNLYSQFLTDAPERNLILIRQNNLIGSNSNFISAFQNNSDVLFDDPIFIAVDQAPIYLIDDTRVIF